MQHLPNLGRLDLRLRARTGANQDDDGGDDDDDFDYAANNDDARRVRQRVALLNPEQESYIQRFLDKAVRIHMGLTENDPPPSETDKDRLIAEVRSEVAQMYQDLPDDWPDKLSSEEGLAMFPAGEQPTAEALVRKIVALWRDGFTTLDAKRKSERLAIYEQIKKSMQETERKEADAADDDGYFDDRTPDTYDVPSADRELRAELQKKVTPGDEKRWAQEGSRDRCCTGAWGRL